jgi:chemotaxis protein MotB
MRTIQVFLSVLIVAGLGLSSCIPGKRLESYENQISKLKQDSTDLQNKLKAYNEPIQSQGVAQVSSENEDVINEIKALSPKSETTSADQTESLQNLQEIIKIHKETMDGLKTSILEALKFFTPDELYVYIKNGNVYVSFEEQLLFDPGTDSIVPSGKAVLKELAVVLKNNMDVNVMVEGHTDNSLDSCLAFKDKWEVSTAKANSVVRILTNDFGFDSKRITASGKAEFHPVNTNETSEGRKSNRRTEIILSLSLSEVFNLLYSSVD